ARMCAQTGDTRWESRYKLFEPKLDEAIKESVRLAPEAYENEAASATDAANTALVDMETRAFALVQEGRRAAATALLFSPAYEEQKRIYAAGMATALGAIHHRSER